MTTLCVWQNKKKAVWVTVEKPGRVWSCFTPYHDISTYEGKLILKSKISKEELRLAEALAGVDGNGGVRYGFDGIGIQSVNRILYAIQQHAAKATGYRASIFTWGVYGMNPATGLIYSPITHKWPELERASNLDKAEYRKRDDAEPIVMISYLRDDYQKVKLLWHTLEKANIRTWVDWIDIQPGKKWKMEIKDAIRKADYFLACFSERYYERSRSYMNEELVEAIEEIRLRRSDSSWFIPISLDGTQIPSVVIGRGETLQDFQWIDLHSDWDTGITRLINTITVR